eukprot:CAMPEP_0204528566 /NCGR_PEP_ID=MMETSP0661-20131031/9595_1 /ASSEMBLY_ACC=CAM_ASM_000606 /TAXON_ID=109239 /ORGANISM="Alexandrium margalefi, Strain AMGDE01CS-322" /LENGTH=255 /DNA_ID=CAMNT_0051534547 /DNA_START=68 /DNA_END=835 /DNA_ORIENTATION=-
MPCLSACVFFLAVVGAQGEALAQAPTSDDAVIAEFNDAGMGMAFSMFGDGHWDSTKWDVLPAPGPFASWAQYYVSIMTRKTDMSVYRTRSHGLMLHISPQYDYWKYFQVIAKGDKKGHIVGGPADGGSHTPPGSSWRRLPESEGKDYGWFKTEKDHILSLYNTVYHNHDYNEFITNGFSRQAIAGVLHYTRTRSPGPTDKSMCSFLCLEVGSGAWPVYAYSRGSLHLERHLNCTADPSAGQDYGCNRGNGTAIVV